MSRRAIFWVSVNGNDVTAGLSSYVTSIRIRDAAGLASDTATIDVEDSYGQLQLPEAGAAISIGLGWEGGAALVMFDGVVDDIGSTGGRGQGRMLSITAKSADTRGSLKEKQEKHKDKVSFGTVATEWGQAAGLSEVAVHSDLAAIERPWWGMQGESYLAWGTRHARELGATFKVMGTRAVFVPRSQGQSASGKLLQAIRAAWGKNLISWSLKPVLGRPVYGKFRVRWFDQAEAKWKTEDVEAEDTDAPAVATDRVAAASPAEAQGRAGSRRTVAEREGGGGSVTIDGEPAAQAEAECEVIGARPGIDGTYRIDVVEHSYSRSGGFTTTLTLKQPAGEAGTDSRSSKAATANQTPTATPKVQATQPAPITTKQNPYNGGWFGRI
jgi:phage protein D